MKNQGKTPKVRFEDPLAYFGRARTRLYSWWVGHVYPFAHFGSKLRIQYPIRLDRREAGQISLGSGVTIGKDAWLNTVGEISPELKIIIGDNCEIGSRVIFSARNQICIEDDVMVAAAALIQDHHHAFDDPSLPISRQGVTPGGRIRIERGCWIGQGVAIVCNEGELVIGHNSVVGSNALVTRSFAPYSVIIGNPARLARQFNPTNGSWAAGEASGPSTPNSARHTKVNGSHPIGATTVIQGAVSSESDNQGVA